MKIKIMTDSASDISVADEKRYSIAILPFEVMLGDKTYVSRVDFDEEGFYELMKTCDEIPKTSQITPYRFEEIYLENAKEGITDLVIVLINSEGSSTYGNSVLAIDMFYEDYPEYKDSFKVYTFDGQGYNAMYGEPVVRAAEMAQNGASVSEITDYLGGILPKRQIYFGIYDLKYAGKSGRIPTAAAFIGSKLNIKPVMKIHDHRITTAAKCIGERKLLEKVASLSFENMAEGSPYQVIYGSDPTCKDEIEKKMTDLLGYPPTGAYRIGAAVATNAGPKVVGVAFNVKEN